MPSIRDVAPGISIFSFTSVLICHRFTRFSSAGGSSLVMESALYSQVPPIYMLVLLINEGNLTRLRLLERFWGSDFRCLSPRSVYRVGCAIRNLPIPGATFVSAGEAAGQLLYMFEDHLSMFLQDDRLRWLVRTTEDCFIHLLRFPVMIRELEQRYDPLKDVVMIGQSIEINPLISMIHGGSGWVMSRAAAEFYTQHRKYIVGEWKTMRVGDDVMPHFFRKAANLSANQTNHYGFIGSSMNDESFRRMRNNNYTNLAACPSFRRQEEMKRFIMPFGDFVFWHSGRNDMISMTDGYRLARDVPKGLAFAHGPSASALCNASLKPSAETDATWS